MEKLDLMQPLDVTHLPEYKLLSGDGIHVSPEVTQADTSDAERLRTQCSLNCLELILRGDDAAYEQLTAPQNEETKLQRSDFAELHEWFTNLLPTERDVNVMRYIMLVHDLGKNIDIVSRVLKEDEVADHDEVLCQLLNGKDEALRNELLPTFAALDEKSQELVRHVLSQQLNLGQFMQAEAPAGVLDDFSVNDSQVIGLYVAHALLDIAGVVGHVNVEGSLSLTSPLYKQAKLALAALSAQGSASERYAQYLAARAARLGVDIDAEQLQRDKKMYALVRLACLLRIDTPAEFAKLQEAYAAQILQVQAILESELTRTGVTERATLPYYAPALLRGLVAHNGLARALTYFAHVLQEVHIADKAARKAGETGIVVADLGELARLANQGELDLDQSELRFDRKGDVYVPHFRDVPPISLNGLPTFDGEQLRGKKIMYLGMGGGSDGLQAATLSQLHKQAYGSEPVAIISVRASVKPVEGEGRHISENTFEVTPQTKAVGNWRFLEDIVAKDETISTPMYLLNSEGLDAMPAVIVRDLQALINETGAEVVVGIDTGGDVLYRTTAVDVVDSSPDQDSVVLAALNTLGAKNPELTVLASVMAPGVDTPDYANDVLADAHASQSGIVLEYRPDVEARYKGWRMDGSGSEDGLYGKTPLALLAALRGDYGVQPLMLPRANATSSENPWRIYMNIRPAVSGLVVMQAADLYRATTK